MKEIQAQIGKILEEYTDEVAVKVARIAESVARDVANDLRSTSPRGKGKRHYADGWRVKRETVAGRRGTAAAIVYNATKPGLTSLLERGHVVRNQYGTYGRARAIPHIGPAEERGNAEFLRRLESEL